MVPDSMSGTSSHLKSFQQDSRYDCHRLPYFCLQHKQTDCSQFWWLCEPFYVICNMSIKASIGMTLLRLCISNMHKTIIWTVLMVTELYSAFLFFIFLFQRLPSRYFWEQYTSGSGSCMDPYIVVAVFYGYSAITCAGDWTFSILPVFLVWDLQMGRKEKVSVIMILAVGAL